MHNSDIIQDGWHISTTPALKWSQNNQLYQLHFLLCTERLKFQLYQRHRIKLNNFLLSSTSSSSSSPSARTRPWSTSLLVLVSLWRWPTMKLCDSSTRRRVNSQRQFSITAKTKNNQILSSSVVFCLDWLFFKKTKQFNNTNQSLSFS